MDVVRLFSSLIAVHRQQQQSLAQQGEIQAEILAQLLEQEDINPIMRSSDDMMDDAEAHLIILEEALTSSKLSNVKYRLASLLGDESLRAEAPDYGVMKASLLDHARETEIQKQQDFSSVRYDPQKGPRALGQWLQSAAQRWLRPERRTAMEIVGCVALQRFISLLPEDVRVHVLRRCPRDMEHAMCMAEEHLRDLRDEESRVMDSYAHGEGHPAHPTRKEQEPGCADNIASEKMEERNTWGPVERHIIKQEAFVDEEYLLKDGVNVVEEIDNNGLYSEAGHASGVGSNAISMERHQLRNMTNMVSAPEKLRRDLSASEDSETALQTPSYLQDYGKHDTRTHHLHSYEAFKMFPCLECDQRFDSQKDLTQHRRNHAKIHSCPECGKKFRDKYNLKCHMRTHTGERPYTCQYCGKKFSQEHGLLQHINIHTGEKPFRCAVCGMGFHHSRTLKKHTVLHSQERPFLCAHCGVTFKLNDTLKKHLRTHMVEGQDVNRHLTN